MGGADDAQARLKWRAHLTCWVNFRLVGSTFETSGPHLMRFRERERETSKMSTRHRTRSSQGQVSIVMLDV
ncbi:hypothetical protein PAXRUDRAFT_824799 [Paxillus rubicundulus Ve08.2h10]|uniref:Uncharacterized protein n=1 Tax=Paxillus rubicundulus Ve08.2h10 TaxID=930991 RepID=A0A0D0E7B1_9AGAM|nr:hypothetical protein PAXRUDRAFT_824799 [Paxillus rubicundulus Ve08.2h10]